MKSFASERTIGLIIVILYGILATAYALRTPPYQNPDEPAHIAYIAQIAANGCCPVIAPGDWDQTALDTLTGSNFAPETLGALENLQYEDHQPPLYYLVASIVYRLTNGSILALRLLSVLFGAGVVVCAYFAARLVIGRWAWMAAGVVAVLPQHLAMMASVNNDSLAELMVGVALILALRLLTRSRDNAQIPYALFIGMGIVTGLGALTKVNTLFLFGLMPLAILLWAWQGERRKRHLATLLPALIAFLVPALLLAGVWWARNLGVYGGTDFLGLAAHDAVVVGQPRTEAGVDARGIGGYLRFGLETTFNSFFGQFGWMALPLQSGVYTLIVLGVILTMLGGVIAWVDRRSLTPSPAPSNRVERASTPSTRVGRGWRWDNPARMWIFLVAAVVIVVLQFGYYNLTFQQFQGRYLYPALIPAAIFAAASWRAWAYRLTSRSMRDNRLETRLDRGVLPGAIPLLGLTALNVWVLWRVLPGLNA